MVITAAQRRRNLDLDNRCVRVTETVYEFGQLVKGTPKSRASIRTVVLPELIVPELRRHLDTFAGDGPDDFVFVGVKGGQLRRSNFSKSLLETRQRSAEAGALVCGGAAGGLIVSGSAGDYSGPAGWVQGAWWPSRSRRASSRCRPAGAPHFLDGYLDT